MRLTATILAAAACAAGSLTVPVPAQAQPRLPLPATPSPDCDWSVWATDSDISFSGHTAHIQWGSHDASASFDGKPDLSPVSGPIIVKGTNELDFSIKKEDSSANFETLRGFTNTYSGTIDPGGAASGTWHNDQGGSGTWTMGNTFKCIGKAPAAGGVGAEAKAGVGGTEIGVGAPPPAQQAPPPEKPPTDAIRMVIAKQGGSVKVTVTSTANIPGRCTYDASEASGLLPTVNRTFDIDPKGTAELSFPAPLPLQSWRIVVACSGDFNGQNVEFGRQVQNI